MTPKCYQINEKCNKYQGILHVKKKEQQTLTAALFNQAKKVNANKSIKAEGNVTSEQNSINSKENSKFLIRFHCQKL